LGPWQGTHDRGKLLIVASVQGGRKESEEGRSREGKGEERPETYFLERGPTS
jgi:hypothetical protein